MGHWVFFDFDAGATERVIGAVDFDSDVLAIMTSTGTLVASGFLRH